MGGRAVGGWRKVGESAPLILVSSAPFLHRLHSPSGWTSHPPTRRRALPHFIEEEAETREGSALVTQSMSDRSCVQPSVHPVWRSFPGRGWAWGEEGPAAPRCGYPAGTCGRLAVQSSWRPTRYSSILSIYNDGIVSTGPRAGSALVKKPPHHVNDTDILYLHLQMPTFQ